MSKKRPIDLKRDAAGVMTVGEADDPVKEIFAIGEHLHALKMNSIYEIKLADEIDPERQNIDVPNANQKVLSYGANSPFIGQVLLTAKQLFNPSYLPKNIDTKLCLVNAFEATKNIAAMVDAEKALTAEVDAGLEALKVAKLKNGAVPLPSIANPFARTKDFLQKADHTLQSLFLIVRAFYPTQKNFFEGFCERITATFGENDAFAEFMNGHKIFLIFIRRARNAVEHPSDSQKVLVRDFSMRADGSVARPMLEVIDKNTPCPESPVSQTMGTMIERLSLICECVIAGLCDKHVQQVGGIQFSVLEFPEDQRAVKDVRYSYGLFDRQRLIRAG
jgi:hypothetical protein